MNHISNEPEQPHRGAGSAMVQVEADGGQFDAYLSAPGTGKGPGVVVITSIFGVDQDTKDICDALAARGCVAMAPNFFWRDQDPGTLGEADIQRAIARVMRVDAAKVMGDLDRAIEHVRRHPNANGKVAVLGYCFGGPYAWRSACDGLGVDAAVSFHGTYVSKATRPDDKPACPVAFHYGDHDEYAPPQELDAVKKMADATGSDFVVHGGAGHAYMMPGKSHYHAQAARDSWNAAMRMIDALRT